MDQPRPDAHERDEWPGMSVGQRICAVLALAALAGGAVALSLSCCTSRRPIPVVPALPPAPPVIHMPEAVRIRVASEGAVEVACRHGGTWFADVEAGGQLLASGTGPWALSVAEGELALDGRPLTVQSAEFESAAGLFQLEGRSYRGKLIARAAEAGIETLNVLPPETYLASVVGSEMYADWPLNALMAQAVAARTYLLHAHAQKGHLTTVDMAYRGIEAENRAADLAVELTRGIVMTYSGRPFSAYFHSTCGGHTAPVDKVFGDELIAPLAGVACEWCRRSPAYRWQAVLPAEQIARALADWGVAAVQSVRPLETEPYGYPRQVLINGEKRMNANQFRLAVGGRELKSTRFTVSRQGEAFLFEGRGFGHGVGLCQWGAFGLAEAGRDWRQILLYYYPDAQLQEIF